MHRAWDALTEDGAMMKFFRALLDAGTGIEKFPREFEQRSECNVRVLPAKWCWGEDWLCACQQLHI